MPKTLDKTAVGQIIGGTFSNRENADKAVEALEELGVSDSDIQVIVQLNDKQSDAVYTDILTDRGFADSQARFYDKAVRDGKILVVVYNVEDSAAEVIDVFDKYKAEYNPNGSRNVREDVIGMTTGAVVGAAAGGVAGAVLGGPVGAAAGAAAGAVVGGGGGAAVGKAAEHRK